MTIPNRPQRRSRLLTNLIAADPAVTLERPIAFYAITGALFLLSCWGIYFIDLGLPILSIVGSLIFLVAAPSLFSFGSIALSSYKGIALGALSLVVITLISAAYGLLIGLDSSIKAPLGMTLGALLFGCVVIGRENILFRESLFRAFTIVGLLHFALFLYQFLNYQAFGVLVDYVEWLTGEPSRFLHGTLNDSPRFTGAFSEPAQHSTFVFLILFLRVSARQFRLNVIDLLFMFEILMTWSAYGTFLLLMCVAPALFRSRYFLRAAPLFAVVLFVFITYGPEESLENLSSRIEDPLQDSSGSHRFVEGYEAFIKLSPTHQVFGFGLGNKIVTEITIGSHGNNIYYLLYYFGIAGTFLLISNFIIICLAAGAERNLLWASLVSLLGAVVVTTPLWWIWLGALIVHAPNRTLKRTPPPSAHASAIRASHHSYSALERL